MTYSEFEKCIAIDLVEDPRFKDILFRVANYHRPGGFENGFFTLKDECWREIDPFFSHFLKMSRNELEMRYADRQSRGATKNIPPLDVEDSSPMFRSISNSILQSRILHSIIFLVIRMTLRDRSCAGSLTNIALYVVFEREAREL